MALVEGQELETVSAVKDGWHQALEDASKILKWPEGFTIQYNPAIWRGSRYTVGIKLLSNPFDDILIFEFSTPNYVLPFDCFASPNAKMGVMLHEIAHRIDDARWGFDLRGLRREAGDYITREQRAELLAFACCPVGVFASNLALVQSTARMAEIELGHTGRAWAAAETVGHAGLTRDVDAVDVFREMHRSGIPMDKLLKAYLCSFVFALAGLTTVPDQNGSQHLGIKRSKDLTRANELLCRHLHGDMELEELEERLLEIGYYVQPDEAHDPLSSLDLTFVDREAAKEKLEQARSYFARQTCFGDLERAVEKIGTRLNRGSSVS